MSYLFPELPLGYLPALDWAATVNRLCDQIEAFEHTSAGVLQPSREAAALTAVWTPEFILYGADATRLGLVSPLRLEARNRLMRP